MPGISIPCHVIFLPLWYCSFVLAILFPLLKVHNFCDKKTKISYPLFCYYNPFPEVLLHQCLWLTEWF